MANEINSLFSSSGLMGLPERGKFSKETNVITVPTASVQGMSVTEVEILAGKSNVILWPRMLIVKKLAGAYGVAGIPANGLMLGYGSVADNIPIFPWGASPAFSLLVSAGEDITVSGQLFHNGAAAGLPFGTLAPLSVVGKKIAMRTITASPTGAGGNLRVKLFYDEIPIQFFDL
jgi:hypothetical protein